MGNAWRGGKPAESMSPPASYRNPCHRGHTDVESCPCGYTIRRQVIDGEVRLWLARERAALLIAEHSRRTASEWPLLTGQQRADAVKTYMSHRAVMDIGGQP